MKILLVLMFILSFGSSAQCYVQAPLTGTTEQTLIATTDTLDTCTGFWISSASEVKNQMSAEVTPEGFVQAFTFGLSLYLTFWFGPYVVSLAKQIINRL